MNIESQIKALIDSCTISSLDSSILVSCPNISVYRQLIRNRRMIIKILCRRYQQRQNHVRRITIGIGELSVSLKVSLPIVEMINTTTQKLIIPTLQHDLIEECLAYEGACGIVRMHDHKGLFSNAQIVFSSNAHPNDWLGKKMSDYWIEPELTTYLQRLARDGELRNYSYVAKMFSGENARLTVDARTIVWNGEVARMVKTVSRELLA